jgi:hypothetical protein
MTNHVAALCIAGVLGVVTLPFASASAAQASPGQPVADVVAGAQAQPDIGFVTAAKSTCDVFIAPNGADSPTGGGPTAPLAHLSYAVGRLTAGKVACLASGSYQDANALTTTSGTATAPIVIRAAPGATSKPVLNLSASKAALWIDNAYWIVDGLDFNLAGKAVSGVVVNDPANHVVLRNSRVHSGAGGAAVYITGEDVAIENNEIGDDFKYTSSGVLDDAHGVAVTSGAARVRVAGNKIYNNSGDGLQCDYTGAPSDSQAPVDLTVQDNRFWTDPAHYGQVEQGVDIKACRRVSIVGSVAPDVDDANAANQKFYGYVTTPGGRGGGAIVLHIGASNVLIANNRMWNDCFGVTFGDYDFGRPDGLHWPDTQSVVIRRNVIFNLDEAAGCGNAIFAQRAQHVDIYHNTIDDVPLDGIAFGTSNGLSDTIGDFDVWNNIIRDAGRFLHLSTATVSSFTSDYNIFYGTSGATNRFLLNGGTPRSLAGWQSGGNGGSLVLDPHSRVVDPLFVAGAGTTDDYYTQAGSPARDTGLANTGSLVAGAGPDIGFRETY